MGEVNAATLIATQKSFSTIFMESMMGATARWTSRAGEISMTTRLQNINWLGRAPAMREWLDSKQSEQLRGFDFALATKDWESTIEVDRNDIEDDTFRLYKPAIQMLGIRAKQFPDKRLSQIRVANGACYDTKALYAIDHEEGHSGQQSNLLTGTSVTAADIRTDYFAAIKAFRKFRDDKGELYIEDVGNVDVIATIPPELEMVFGDLNNPGPGSLTAKTIIPFEVDGRLTDPNDWYLDFVAYPIKPFLKLNRKETQFVALDNPNTTESVFMRKKFAYGVEGRGDIMPGFWQLTTKTTNA